MPTLASPLHRRLMMLAALAPLAACGSPAPAPRPSPTATGFIARMKALSPGDLKLTLYRAILKSNGAACQGVTAVDPQPPAPNGDPKWRATCLDRSLWYVEAQDDGTLLVLGAPSTNG